MGEEFKPFGRNKKKWPSRAAYEDELRAFKRDHRHLEEAQVLHLWRSKPEHMGRTAAKKFAKRIAREARRRTGTPTVQDLSAQAARFLRRTQGRR